MTTIDERAAAVRARLAASRGSVAEPLPPVDIDLVGSTRSAAVAEPPRASVDVLRGHLVAMRADVLQRLLECGTPEPGDLQLVANIGATLQALDGLAPTEAAMSTQMR